ncbi:hypothetical protein V6N11_069070 [Hibiscus sabdariffa]|uniref:Uncharacterized protein n=1 Tax=Hibiscus sabdariffa TaxID=183260 RepID=A0ABR2A1K4_9ROSI
MKWTSLLHDIKEKVGLTHSSAAAASPATTATSSSSSPLSSPSNRDAHASYLFDYIPSPSRDKHELELDFKRFWEEFRSSNSEKEKEAALNLTVDAFCRLVKQHANVAHLVTQVTFMCGDLQGGFCPGSNLLTTIEFLVSGPTDKQSLLDSGIFCCLIHILNAFLSPDEANQKQNITDSEESMLTEKDSVADVWQARQLKVEGSVVHIMKALASHPSAAQSLVEDDSLMLLFQMVANGSVTVFSRYKEDLVSLHTIQLHRHAMQILGLLLENDNGSTAKYIHKHHLIKVLLMAVKGFNPDCGDPAYTVGIVDMLLECVELSCRPEADGIRLREDIRSAHGYHYFVQFALVLSSMPQNQGIQSIFLEQQADEDTGPDSVQAFDNVGEKDFRGKEDQSSEHLSPTLCRLLDVLVNLALTGPAEDKCSQTKASDHSRSRSDETWELGNNKVKDLEAIQMLQDIFLRADRRDLQAEVLNRMFKIFSSHLENYMLCQQLRTVPLLILNMAGFPSSLQEIILKILEYAVTVVNSVPEQELLSLCCLLQQPITSELKLTILSFFVKLLSFDQQYKKAIREVGMLKVLLDDLEHHKLQLGPDQNGNDDHLERKPSSSTFKKRLGNKGIIINSPKLTESDSEKFSIFEVESTITVAWDCMVSLLKKTEANQASFRSSNGVTIILPFLVSNIHRPGVLRTLSCLITEDTMQDHPEELGALVEVLKSGMVTSVSGYPYKLQSDAKCDVMGALWRILGLNDAAQSVFGEATAFSLLLTSLNSFQGDGLSEGSSLLIYIKLFTFLLRLMTAGVRGNAINRTKLHTVISSQTFYDLLSESGLLCMDYEKQVVHLLLELALEIVLPLFMTPESVMSADVTENESTGFLLTTPSGLVNIDKERVYNAGAVKVLIRSLFLLTSEVQLQVLDLIGKLAHSGPFNQENLTSAGCVELLLEIIHPFLSGSSPILSYALKIVEVLGAYRLSTSELRVLVRYILQMRLMKSGHTIVDMMERLILMEDTALKNVSLAPFVEMDMSKIGHASVQVSLGERSWPPAAGYSFVCWFQFQNFLRKNAKEADPVKGGSSKRKSGSDGQHHNQHILQIFSVGSLNDENTSYAELYLQEDGVLTLATSTSFSLSFSGLELEEGRWHHLAVVHSKPNALAGLFQASIAYVYLDGKLRHTGKLGYSPSPIGKPLLATIGTLVTCARDSDLTWRLRTCYLFDEVLMPGAICFMYILGRAYRGLFHDADLLRFVPNQACGGGSMAILDSLDTDLSLPIGTQKLDSTSKQGDSKADGSGIVWNMDRIQNLSFQLYGKTLIFAFDGTYTEAVQTSGTSSMVNLVDPLSTAASPIGGIPRYGRLHGNIHVCRQCVIGDTIRPIGGMAVILALVQAAETRDMLHVALSFLACALRHNPQNVRDMQTYRGYHLLALFLHRKMSLFDVQCLEIFFQIAACEASFSEPKKLELIQIITSPTATIHETSFEDLNFSKFHDETSSVGSLIEMDYLTAPKDSVSHISELENPDIPVETSNCIVLSNADMVEHILLDWTLWASAPVFVQIALLNFLEHLVSMHWYRNHNLTVLRQIKLVQHLLATLQRDVEVPVLEKIVAVLGVILEDGFLPSELENVVRFVIMTFDPPELKLRHRIMRESMGKHVIVRNMLLEMLIDLQVTIKSEEMLEQWHRIVSSKIITYFLDEAVHPTSMRWIMTLLGVCLASSLSFSLKFRTIGGYQGLTHVLPSVYDSPDVYYILFCLIFGKPVYPRLPEVRMLDFHALMPSDADHVELKFIELLDSIVAMAKSTFDRLSMQLILASQTGSLYQLVAELVEENADTAAELQGEALMHKTYAARLMAGEASAPATATSVLRFMVDLAKMCPTFSAVCRRAEFLESCVDVYFSCVRSAHTVKMARELSAKTKEKILNDCDDAISQNTFSSFVAEQEQSAKISICAGSCPQAQVSSSSEEIPVSSNIPAEDKDEMKPSTSQNELDRSVREDMHVIQGVDSDSVDQVSAASGTNEFSFHCIKDNLATQPSDSHSSVSLAIPDSPILLEKSNSKISLTQSVISWSSAESKIPIIATPSMDSSTALSASDQSSDLRSGSGPTATNTTFSVSPKLLLEVDDSGYSGGPCSAGATAMLDFMAEVLADFLTEQIKATQIVESILEMVPLYVETESVLVFQGLFLSRLMNFFERRLLRDDEEDENKLDKTKWSSNLDALCWMIVDRVYMGAFPEPTSVLKTLDFLLSMLQLANKDGRIEEAAPSKGLFSITRGSRQLDAYVQSILKNTNRMILYCFLPSFLVTIGEDDLLSSLGLLKEPKKRSPTSSSQEDSGIDICSILQLLVAHRRVIFCPSNLDPELNSCLCVNLISLLRDRRKNVQNVAIDVVKYLLVHRKASLRDLLVCKPNQGQHLDVLHGGFDKLLTGSLSAFFEWFQSSEHIVNKVLEQCAGIMWMQHIAVSTKFPGIRIKGIEGRRKREMGRRSRDASKIDLKHQEQVNERRYSLEMVRDAMSAELRIVRHEKYGWVLHAESEWHTHLQQLVHERGIFPIPKTVVAEYPEWQLCPIEGPYRMRKKLERCKLRINSIQNVLDWQLESGEEELSKVKNEDGSDDSDSEAIFDPLNDSAKQNGVDTELYDESLYKVAGDVKEINTVRNYENDDIASSLNETSLHSALEFGGKSSAASVPLSESIHGKSDYGTPRVSAKFDEVKATEDKLDKELHDNGEYLVRPYLEPREKIRFRYNCERVVGLDKHDGVFLIGELCLYVIENFYIDDSACICEKEFEDDLSVIDQALGVRKDSMTFQSKPTSSWATPPMTLVGGRAWAYNDDAWGKEKVRSSGNLPHLWRMWKLDNVHELLKRDYQLRPVAVELFSMDGCNDLLVFHKRERDEVFKNLVAMNLPRNSMLDTTISGSTKQESNEGSGFFKIMDNSFLKRWQNGEITNFQYLMHLNTLAGRGYSDLTQYPVFPWVLADYESEELDLSDPKNFRKLDKPIGCQTLEGEQEFMRRYESWDDPEVPKFHYGSHYSSAGIVLYYLLRLPPFSAENQKLQGGQFDHADRLFDSIRDTWLSASGKGNTSDVKELIPEFFYMPEFLENRFRLDLGEKQSGEKVSDVHLPPWAKGSAREFIRRHREALESDFVSENLHHWIDLIFGYKQRGKAAEQAVNVFYHYTYEGNVDIDAITDPLMKASILAQINHFGQTPKQLFQKPHVKRHSDRRVPPHPLKHSARLVAHAIQKTSSFIAQISSLNDRILVGGTNTFLKPGTSSQYVAWGFPDGSLRFMTYDQDRLISVHENLHWGNQIQCAGVSHDGQFLVTGGDDGAVSVWRISTEGPRALIRLQLANVLCAHTAKITRLHVCQPYMLIVSGSDDCTAIIWDLSSFRFIKQLPKFPAPVSALYVNDLTGEVLTAAGILFAVWSINGDCLAVINASQLPSDSIHCLTSCTFSDWLDTNWYVTGHQSGAIKVWHMIHYTEQASTLSKFSSRGAGVLDLSKSPEYKLVLHKVLKFHANPVTALHITADLKQLLSGDSAGNLLSWTLPDVNVNPKYF